MNESHYEKLGILGSSRAFTRFLQKLNETKHHANRILILGEQGTGKDYVARSLYHGYREENVGIVFPGEPFTSSQVAKLKWLHIHNLDLWDESNKQNLARLLERHPLVKLVATSSAQEGESLLLATSLTALTMPSLRDRRSDIPILLKRWVEEWNTRINGNRKLLPSAVRYFQNSHWPGNLTQLRNVLQQCLLQIDDETIGEAAILGSEIARLMQHPHLFSLKRRIESTKREHIALVVKQSRSLRHAARELEISPQTLLRMMKSLRLKAKSLLPPKAEQ